MTTGHPRHWPRNSLFGTVFDPLHVILPPLGIANTSQVLGSCEDQHQTHSSPRVFQAGVLLPHPLLRACHCRLTCATRPSHGGGHVGHGGGHVGHVRWRGQAHRGGGGAKPCSHSLTTSCPPQL
ncbi:hypothetical protein HaLaN_03210 [Haematococcus lacustris]|uniref:Uncharacterized protein n=1 Tax=Haematococcus lacustris TaxID=44745 RepID=A0A699YGC7_HAELA|nr:hypothetical protein HaLaN_03210 [Haematococcus lacustris]